MTSRSKLSTPPLMSIWTTPQPSAGNSPRFDSQQSFFNSRLTSRRVSVLDPRSSGLILQNSTLGVFDEKQQLTINTKPLDRENVFQPVQQNSWGIKYFAAATDALQKIADNDFYLDWLKILLGPDPVIKDEKPKTPYEKKQEDNLYMLSLAMLNLFANFHDQVFHQRVLQGYKNFVEHHFQEKYAMLNRIKTTLKTKIEAQKNKDVTVKVKAYQLEEMIEGTSTFANTLLQPNLNDQNVVQNSINLSNNLIEYLTFLESKNFKLHELRAKLEEADKEEQNEIQRQEAEKKLITQVQEMYQTLLPGQEDFSYNPWIMINYTARGKQLCTETEDYQELSQQMMDGSASTIAYKAKKAEDAEDFALQDLFRLFAQAAKISRKDSIYLTQEEIESLKQQMSFTLNEAHRELTERSATELEALVKINPKSPGADELKLDVKEKMVAFFSNSLLTQVDKFLNMPEMNEFTRTRNLTAFIRVLETSVEHCIKLFKNLKDAEDPKVISNYEIKQTQSVLQYRTFVKQWKNKNWNKIPLEYREITADALSQDIVQLRENNVPLSDIHETQTGDTLLHKASQLYNNAGNDINKQKRLIKAIQLLYLHGADAFSPNNKGEWAYRHSTLQSPSMLDWEVVILQLKNKVMHSQYTQLLLRCLYEYCEENNRIFNQSPLYYVYGYWMNKDIKLDRLRCIWNILASIEKNKSLVDDRSLIDQIGALIHGDTWQRKDSSDLRTKLDSLNKQGASKNILVFDLSPSKKVLQKNEELNQELQDTKAQLKKALLEKQQTEFVLMTMKHINFSSINTPEMASPLQSARQYSTTFDNINLSSGVVTPEIGTPILNARQSSSPIPNSH